MDTAELVDSETGERFLTSGGYEALCRRNCALCGAKYRTSAGRGGKPADRAGGTEEQLIRALTVRFTRGGKRRDGLLTASRKRPFCMLWRRIWALLATGNGGEELLQRAFSRTPVPSLKTASVRFSGSAAGLIA